MVQLDPLLAAPASAAARSDKAGSVEPGAPSFEEVLRAPPAGVDAPEPTGHAAGTLQRGGTSVPAAGQGAKAQPSAPDHRGQKSEGEPPARPVEPASLPIIDTADLLGGFETADGEATAAEVDEPDLGDAAETLGDGRSLTHRLAQRLGQRPTVLAALDEELPNSPVEPDAGAAAEPVLLKFARPEEDGSASLAAPRLAKANALRASFAQPPLQGEATADVAAAKSAAGPHDPKRVSLRPTEISDVVQELDSIAATDDGAVDASTTDIDANLLGVLPSAAAPPEPVILSIDLLVRRIDPQPVVPATPDGSAEGLPSPAAVPPHAPAPPRRAGAALAEDGSPLTAESPAGDAKHEQPLFVRLSTLSAAAESNIEPTDEAAFARDGDPASSVESPDVDSQSSNTVDRALTANPPLGEPRAEGPVRGPEAARQDTTADRGSVEAASASGDRVRFAQRVMHALQAAEARGGPVRLRLSPPELGAMRLELAMRDGTLQARLEVETPAARTLLLESLPHLRERLASQDIKIERFEVDLMNQRTGDGSPRARDHEHAGNGGYRSTREAVEPSDAASEPAVPTSAWTWANGRIDVVI